MRLKPQEAKPNGSNEKVSLQFVVKILIEEEEQWQVTEFFIPRKRKEVFESLALLEQPWRIVITLETRVKFLLVEEEIEWPEVWTESLAISRARNA